jgi:hypothetical protein
MKTNTTTLTPELLHQMDAANHLSVGQIYSIQMTCVVTKISEGIMVKEMFSVSSI